MADYLRRKSCVGRSKFALLVAAQILCLLISFLPMPERRFAQKTFLFCLDSVRLQIQMPSNLHISIICYANRIRRSTRINTTKSDNRVNGKYTQTQRADERGKMNSAVDVSSIQSPHKENDGVCFDFLHPERIDSANISCSLRNAHEIEERNERELCLLAEKITFSKGGIRSFPVCADSIFATLGSVWL